MIATDRRMEMVSILVVSGHVTSRDLAFAFVRYVSTLWPSPMVIPYTQSREQVVEFLLWTVISRTTIRLHNTSRKTQKLYDEMEGEDKKSWNVFSENMGLIS